MNQYLLVSLVYSRGFKLYTHCLVLLGPRNGFQSDFTIKVKSIKRLMEDLTYMSNKTHL